MYSAEYVELQIEELKKEGNPLQWVAFQVAILCVGWAYVFGARGALCNYENRKAAYKSKGADHPTIKTKCQILRDDDRKSSCQGCKWFPLGCRTRYFDCRGFTYWVLLKVFGFTLQGAGATSQWNTKANWKAQGTIDKMPSDTLVCLFQRRNSKMIHTGFGYNNETVECQNGVQYFKTRNKKWTHWGIPVCVDGSYKPPEKKKDEPKVSKPTLKKGASGTAVKELQTRLIALGYSCGAKGADGKFGNDTVTAVKAFQKAHNLTADGVVGSKTWNALDGAEPAIYTVTVKGLTASQADALIKQFPNSTKTEERGS